MGLADRRYRDFAETFNFARYGETATAFTRTQQGTADLYVRQTMEINAGNENEGVRLALYFQRKAPELSSVYSILADRALLEVVQTALSIPPEASFQSIDRQAEEISKRIDLEDFKDPGKTGALPAAVLSPLGHQVSAKQQCRHCSLDFDRGTHSIWPQLLVADANSSLKIGNR